MALEFTTAEVMLTEGHDIVYLLTELPEAGWPFKGKASFAMDAGRDMGADWVRKHLNVEPQIVNVRHTIPHTG